MYGAEDPGLDLVYVFMLMPQGKPDQCRQGDISNSVLPVNKPADISLVKPINLLTV
ncbi:hypothetical protein M1N15_01780 [Dehalococcoidia bacterium]|nr:hypothetical protein [Dehalococcoidia bacterium]